MKDDRNCHGVALIIILAFLVLLSGLVVAFFSRAISERQVSNSSAHQTKVDLFADGAAETVIADLKQEIAAGSTTPSSSVVPVANTNLYFPKNNMTAVPYRVGLPAAGVLPNLVKRSARQQPFFAGADYDTTNYPPSSRAANVSTTSFSQNARSWSTARWNRALFLPKQDPTSDVDLTPVTGANGFTAPDWVLVARDGTNPTTWSTDLGNSTRNNFVLGRYAYTIYDEGGVLDMNVAGYPTGVTVAQVAAKNALAFADLLQLKDSSGSALLSQAQIDAIISWRNYATTQAPADFPTPAFTSASGVNYVNAVVGNAKGFMAVSNTALYNNQSDRMLAGRQQLMKLLLSGIASQASSAAGKAERANLQNALQYLGTFSRELSQPSFVRSQSVDSGAPGYSAQAPKILDVLQGGNEGSTGDTKLNPTFLTVRVSGTGWKRNDDSTPVQGEPLVKKRFALARLAWLTHKGPIADDNGTLSTDSGVQAAITILTNTYGLPNAFLRLGGPANIKKYFGLVWDSSKNRWKYVQGKNGNTGAILTLSQVAALGSREANFIELLKASICAGSLGKTYMYSSASATNPYWLTPTGYQEERDSSIDAHVIQIAANMIDQFDVDGYPTRINFDDNSLFGSYSAQQEYRGVEDLPYLYRVREGKIMIQDSVPSQYNLPAVGAPPANFSAGSAVVVQEPEIWNPHAWNSAATDNSPRPTSFRLVAVSTDPNGATAPVNVQPGVQWRFQAGPNSTASGTSPAAAVNTTFQFNIPQSPSRRDLFREPTLLLKSNVPAGSNLSGGTPVTSLYPASQYVENGLTDSKAYLCIVLGTVPMAWTGNIPANGIASGNPATATAGVIPAGFVYYPTVVNGITYRLQCQDDSGNWVIYDEKYASLANAGSYNTPNQAPPSYRNKTFGRKDANPYSDFIVGSEASMLSFDPRTSRFGMIMAGSNGRGANSLTFPLGANANNAGNSTGSGVAPYFDQGWSAPVGSGQSSAAVQAAAQQNAVLTTRPDEFKGFSFATYDGFANSFGVNTGPSRNGNTAVSLGGWYPATTWYSTIGGANTPVVTYPGMLAQNATATSSATSAKRFNADPQGLSVTGTLTDPWGGSGTYNYSKQYFADADGVIRRGLAAFVPNSSGDVSPAIAPASGKPSGLPLKPATSYSGGVGVPNTTTNEYASRPIVLNRPFRSVADLGYVFSGTPWRNLDMNTPESGATALLDVFCINDTDDTNGLVAGKVNLNTRQPLVLQAILSGAGKDEFNPASSSLAAPLTSAVASTLATALTARTSSTTAGMGPMTNVSDLVGKWRSSVAVDSSIDGSKSYIGFSSDTANNGNDLTTALSSAFPTEQRIARYREATIRALSNTGQSRVWNLMIDLVAQTGRYPQNAGSLEKFVVEGEQRCWIHVAIDRFTGEVLDKQIEIVKE